MISKNPLSDAKIFSRASWFLVGSFRDESLIAAYTRAGVLPDRLPIAALSRDDWAPRIAILDNALVTRDAGEGVDRKAPLKEARADFVRATFVRMRRSPCRALVPVEFGFDECVIPYGRGSSLWRGALQLFGVVQCMGKRLAPT